MIRDPAVIPVNSVQLTYVQRGEPEDYILAIMLIFIMYGILFVVILFTSNNTDDSYKLTIVSVVAVIVFFLLVIYVLQKKKDKNKKIRISNSETTIAPL